MPARFHARSQNKFSAVRCEVDGQTFDSKFEARVWSELRLREKAGEIRNLRRQVEFPLKVGETIVGKFVADFTYEECWSKTKTLFGWEQLWREVIADAKSSATMTSTYRLKKRIMAAMGFQIREIMSR